MKNRILFLAFTAVCYLSACTNQQNQSGDCQKTIDSLKAILTEDHSSEATAIMKADSAWDRASEAKSAEGWLSFYTDDAIMMPPGENVCKDKASREASIKNMFAIPGVSLRFQDTKVEVSRMGDLGYASGVYQWTSKDAKGKDYRETGKYCETWKKQSDGNWKCIVDIWNADAPLAK
jgi:ketosteroid isomerase-like protein